MTSSGRCDWYALRSVEAGRRSTGFLRSTTASSPVRTGPVQRQSTCSLQCQRRRGGHRRRRRRRGTVQLPTSIIARFHRRRTVFWKRRHGSRRTGSTRRRFLGQDSRRRSSHITGPIFRQCLWNQLDIKRHRYGNSRVLQPQGQHCPKIMKPSHSLPLQMAERSLRAHARLSGQSRYSTLDQ